MSDKRAIASLPVICSRIIFCLIRVERRAGLDRLFPKTVTLTVKPAPTEFTVSGKCAIAFFSC
ncbi:hypothetical protein [Coleofasciculus sp. F4-SAH-05]|uniref:hypothetical protein n=1 Tax=Coleofasciculus sp. F4-SAH-05 TaxID=3069525 RepID=UPI0032F70AE0